MPVAQFHGAGPATAKKIREFGILTGVELEAQLGTQLLRRSTRSLGLTPFGDNYLATCRAVLSALDVAERDAAREHEQPSGLLTITAPLRLGQLHVRPALDAFLDANSAVQARLLLLDRIVTLVEEGVDAAIRVAHLPDSTLIATRLGEVRRVLCAASAYIERHGAPSAPPDLRQHACILERDGAGRDSWRFSSAPGKPLLPILLRPRLVINSASATVDSAVDGHGVRRVMSYQAADAVAAGKLVVLLAQHEPPPIPVHLVLPAGRSATAKQWTSQPSPPRDCVRKSGFIEARITATLREQEAPPIACGARRPILEASRR